MFGLAFPVDFLDVLVHLLGQSVSAPQPAALKYIAPPFGGHAFSETVDARPTPNFGLIRSFWHNLLTSVYFLKVFLKKFTAHQRSRAIIP
jgi:hypothetical protein